MNHSRYFPVARGDEFAITLKWRSPLPRNLQWGRRETDTWPGYFRVSLTAIDIGVLNSSHLMGSVATQKGDTGRLAGALWAAEDGGQ